MPCPRTQHHLAQPWIELVTFRLPARFPHRSATWLPWHDMQDCGREMTVDAPCLVAEMWLLSTVAGKPEFLDSDQWNTVRTVHFWSLNWLCHFYMHYLHIALVKASGKWIKCWEQRRLTWWRGDGMIKHRNRPMNNKHRLTHWLWQEASWGHKEVLSLPCPRKRGRKDDGESHSPLPFLHPSLSPCSLSLTPLTLSLIPKVCWGM